MLPAIQQSIGYDTNPNRSGSFHKSSTVFRTDGEVRLQSDWSAHALTGAMRGSYSEYPNVKGANRPEGEGRLGLRARRQPRYAGRRRRALPARHAAAGQSRPQRRRDRAPARHDDRRRRRGDAALQPASRRPARHGRPHRLRGCAPDERHDPRPERPRLQSIRPAPARRLRADARGDPLRRRARRHAASTTRGSTTPASAAAPTALGVRAGSTFEITRTLTGEASAGLQQRSYEDPRLRDLRGPLVDAALIWSATPLTTVRLQGPELDRRDDAREFERRPDAVGAPRGPARPAAKPQPHRRSPA